MTTIKRLAFILCSAVLFFMLSGCALIRDIFPEARDPEIQQPANPVPVDPHAKAEEKEIILYFKHEIADVLVPERRRVMQEKQTEEQLIVQELLKGPQNFERRSVMPPGTSLIDVVRRADTVFVNVTEDFLNDIVLVNLPGKEDTPESDIPRIQAEMKRLSVYSIVHSLTYLDGVNQVKLLVGNRQLSYKEMGTELLLEEGSMLTGDSPMMAIRRDKAFILTPSKAVAFVLNQLTGEPDWDSVYLFLSDKTMDNSNLPPLDVFKARIPPVIGGYIEYEGNPIEGEEYVMEKAFVTVRYTLRTGNGRRDIYEVLTVDNKNLEGIWKVRLPEFFNQFR